MSEVAYNVYKSDGTKIVFQNNMLAYTHNSAVDSAAVGAADLLKTRYPALWKLHERVGCPRCIYATRRLVGLIAHLNDFHHWTRERIADHLEGLGL